MTDPGRLSRPRYAAPAYDGALAWRQGPAIVSLAAGALVWEIAARALHVPFIVPIAAVAGALWRMTLDGEIPRSLASSVGALATGFGLAAIAGVPVGLISGRSRRVADVLDPCLDALVSVPSLVFVPVFFGIFGLGRVTHVAVVFLYAFVIVAVMARSGLATLDPAYVEMARAFGASERQILRRILLPGALPSVVAGLQLGMGRAVRGLINVEMLIGSTGFGALLRRYGTRFDAAGVYAVVLVLVVLVAAGNSAMRVVQRRVDGSGR